MAFYHLVYTSHATAEVTPEVVLSIVQNCQSNNRYLRISGLLFYQNRRFIQLLEGEEALVRELLESISQDPRHTDMRVLYECTNIQRKLSIWAMGFSSKEIPSHLIRPDDFFLTFDEGIALCSTLPPEIGQHFLSFLSE